VAVDDVTDAALAHVLAFDSAYGGLSAADNELTVAGAELGADVVIELPAGSVPATPRPRT
jgi:hypothetical protein